MSNSYRQVNTQVCGGLCGYVTASYAELCAVFGAPLFGGVDDKVSTEWVVTGQRGCKFSLYDYKETNLYADDLPTVEEFRAQKSYEWHIGGNVSEKQIASFKLWLSVQLGRPVV